MHYTLLLGFYIPSKVKLYLKNFIPYKRKINGTALMIIPQGNNSSATVTAIKQFVSNSVILEPGATKQLVLGSYLKSEPQAEFRITTTPDIEEMLGASLEMMEIPGTVKYMSFYHLHNFSSVKCEVTVTKIIEHKRYKS